MLQLMEEIYDSDFYNIRYDKTTNATVLNWKKYGKCDSYRTPLMNCSEIIRKHSGSDLVVGRTCLEGVTENDRKWVNKILFPALLKAGCKRVFFVTDDEGDIFPYKDASEKFTVVRVKSEEEALSAISKEEGGNASPEILAMSKAEAIEYLGLPPDANKFAIDEKFWQLSKNMRLKNDPETEQRLNDLSAAYDIAIGARDERVMKSLQREQAKKYFGKTSDEWRTYFSYTWYKYLIAVVGVLILANVLYYVLIKPRTDSGIVSIGHFIQEGNYYEELLQGEMGYKNPYVNCVDLVVPNDQGQVNSSPYQEQAATTMFYSSPNVLVCDENTAPYYFDQYVDLTDLYGTLRNTLPAESFAKITPFYFSELEYYEMINDYNRKMNMEENVIEDLSECSTDPVMIGLMVTDKQFYGKLGYENLWPSSEPSLVFGIYNQTADIEASEMMIINIFKDL